MTEIETEIPKQIGPRERVLRPGLPSKKSGVERYRVAGGGSVLFRVFGGDQIRIIDIEGKQPSEVVAFSNGRCNVALLGATITGQGDGLKKILNSKSPSTERFKARLERHQLSLENLHSVDLFVDGSRAGEYTSMSADAEGVVIVSAPGDAMRPQEQMPPTDLEVIIERANPNIAAIETPDLPEPLADPLIDSRIPKRTAWSYEVKAGEWIQVIDVEGRECSDFQAFSAAQLDKGIERCLDVTTTRSLVAMGYPQPGLMAKYYDQDMRPLIELVQDNCCRHDAFGLACTAKYYEDLGYPGHVNCSDNFNSALGRYPIQARPGWMAMNFFYNTGIDDQNQFYLDEPWSRPGDYVLMRALEDLVCVSSACPCDIDSANGWNPTDIHVRTYRAAEKFKHSIGFRKRMDSEVEMTKETGFHPRTSTLTRNYAEYNGYWLPNDYANHGVIAEYWACRDKAIVLDLSALRKFEVVGPDAENLLQYTMTRDIRRLAIGQVVYTAMCYDTGTMIDDGTVFRLGQDNFRWIGGCDYGGEWLREQAAKMDLEVWIKSSTDQLHNLSVQGPLSRDILSPVIWTPPAQTTLEELNWFRFSIGRINKHDGVPILVSRTGYTGELGYEVWCHPENSSEVWDAIWRSGQPHGLKPLGLEALDKLRIEAGLIFAGAEFDDQTDPFEAGIGFTVPLKSKDDDFIGRDALLKRKANPQRKLVGLELRGEEISLKGDCIHVGRQQVGTVTSATKSPILKKNIALSRIATKYADLGTQVEVGKLDGYQKRLPAVVVPLSFYDPEKKRPRS